MTQDDDNFAKALRLRMARYGIKFAVGCCFYSTPPKPIDEMYITFYHDTDYPLHIVDKHGSFLGFKVSSATRSWIDKLLSYPIRLSTRVNRSIDTDWWKTKCRVDLHTRCRIPLTVDDEDVSVVARWMSDQAKCCGGVYLDCVAAKNPTLSRLLFWASTDSPESIMIEHDLMQAKDGIARR